jgi:GT2 family glycosyltransferase
MVSIVIIEYHSLNEICKFAEISNMFTNNTDYELIVSSNSQYSASKQDQIKEEYPNVKWQFNSRNGGFAYGMNEGLKVAKGDVLVIVNPDVKFKTPLEPMVDYLLQHLEVGIIAPKIVDEDGNVQDSFRHFATPFSFIERQVGRIVHRNKLNVKSADAPQKVDWVIGAFMMVRHDFYEKVGGLSEDYFMYCEDEDWCKRANLSGYDVVYYPESVIEYKGTRASRRSWKYAKIHLQSLFTYWRKYGIWG